MTDEEALLGQEKSSQGNIEIGEVEDGAGFGIFSKRHDTECMRVIRLHIVGNISESCIKVFRSNDGRPFVRKTNGCTWGMDLRCTCTSHTHTHTYIPFTNNCTFVQSMCNYCNFFTAKPIMIDKNQKRFVFFRLQFQFHLFRDTCSSWNSAKILYLWYNHDN